MEGSPAKTERLDEQQNIESRSSDSPVALTEFMAQAQAGGVTESSGAFTTVGREVVKRLGRSLLARPTAWTLLLVQIANIWEADKLAFRFPGGAIQVEFQGVGDRREWLENSVEDLVSGHLSLDLSTLLWQKSLWAALAQTQGKLVLAASGLEPSDKTKAVRIGLDSTEWGDSKLAPKTVVIQILPANSEDYLSEYWKKMVSELQYFACSDATLVTCRCEISSFLPISPRAKGKLDDDTQERGLALGLWAVTGEAQQQVRLGRSFASLDADGMNRKELTFGVFRTGLLPVDKEADKSKARSVVAFTHHLQPVCSQIVWLFEGVEVVHQLSSLPPQPLAFTIYRELPTDMSWDLSHVYCKTDADLTPCLQQARDDLERALEAMVGEYNSYSPGIEFSTLGCWGMLLFGSFAFAGMLAPLFGNNWALTLGALLGFGLVWAELKFRYRKRYAVGQSLKALVEDLGNSSSQDLWQKEWLTAGGEKYPEKLEWE